MRRSRAPLSLIRNCHGTRLHSCFPRKFGEQRSLHNRNGYVLIQLLVSYHIISYIHSYVCGNALTFLQVMGSPNVRVYSVECCARLAAQENSSEDFPTLFFPSFACPISQQLCGTFGASLSASVRIIWRLRTYLRLYQHLVLFIFWRRDPVQARNSRRQTEIKAALTRDGPFITDLAVEHASVFRNCVETDDSVA